MVAIAFIGMIQHEISKDSFRKLIQTVKSDAICDSIVVCSADGLFSTASKLDEQLELLFDSGIDLVFVGEQAISRNCCRSVFAKGEWPIIKAINLPGSTDKSSIKRIDHNGEAFWFISTSGQKGKIPVDYSYLKLDGFLKNKNDNLPVIILESNAEYKYLQALAYRYSKLDYSVLLLGAGAGFITSPTLRYSEKCYLQCDIGSVVTENTVNGFDSELWWKKNIERRAITLIPQWGSLICDYSIVYLKEGKIEKFFTKSVRI